MDFKLFLVFSIFVISFAQQSSGQVSERFIVSIIEYDANAYICRSTVITDRHVLTTATCATSSTRRLGVRAELTFGPGSSGTTAVPVERVFIHPDYRAGQPETANVAVLLMAGAWNTTSIPPRALGRINANATCTLFGWGAAPSYPRRELIDVISPQYCNPNTPEVFCSHLPAPDDTRCSAQYGSPIVCSNGGTVDGFVLNSNLACDNVNGKSVLKYHSVGAYQDWIEKVSGAEISAKRSIFIILSALVIAFKRFSFY